MNIATPEIKTGYGLVADTMSFMDAYELAHHRKAVRLIKATEAGILSMGGVQELEDLAQGNFLVICDSQVGLHGRFFKEKIELIMRRIQVNGITLSAQLGRHQIEAIAQMRDDICPELLLVLTAALPEHTELDFDQELYGFERSVDWQTRLRFELAQKLGGCMVYGAPMDLERIPRELVDAVPHMSAGISMDGRPYSSERPRGIATPQKAFELGSRVVLLGTILGDSPSATLDELGVTRTV